MGLFSSKKSSTTNNTTQNFYDQRSVIDAGGGIVGDGNSVDNSLNYLSLSDDRDAYSYFSDASNRSVTNITGSDPGAVRLGELNAQLLGAVAETQTDAVKSLAAFGADGIRAMGASVTDLYSTAGSNTSRAWEHTIDASAGLIDRLLLTSERTTDAARATAAAAINSFEPTANKLGDGIKYAGIGLAVVAALFLLKKA